MQPDLFLIRYGAWLVPALVLGIAEAAVVAASLHRAWQIRRAMRLFTKRIGDARRGLHRASVGDRVVAHGVIALAAETTPRTLGAPWAIVRALLDDQTVCLHAAALELRGAPLVGKLALDAATGEAREVEEVAHDLFLELERAGLRMHHTDPVTLQHVHPGDTVLVLGRAVHVANERRASYRARASTIGIGADDDGFVRVVGLGSPRAHALRVARIAAAPAALGAALLLFAAPIASMHAPRTAWTIPQPEGQLPLAYWLPLASPWRGPALAAVSSWVTPRLYRSPADVRDAEIAFALRDAAPVVCAREVALASALGSPARDGVTDGCENEIATYAELGLRSPLPAPRARDLRRLLVIALDRGAELEPDVLEGRSGDRVPACPECGPVGRARLVSPWSVADVLVSLELRSLRMRRCRSAWLRDLASWEAARGQLDTARALFAASAVEPSDDPDSTRGLDLLARAEDLAPAEHASTLASARAMLPASDTSLLRSFDRVAARTESAPDGSASAAVSIANLAALADAPGAPDAARALASIAASHARRREHPRAPAPPRWRASARTLDGLPVPARVRAHSGIAQW